MNRPGIDAIQERWIRGDPDRLPTGEYGEMWWKSDFQRYAWRDMGELLPYIADLEESRDSWRDSAEAVEKKMGRLRGTLEGQLDSIRLFFLSQVDRDTCRSQDVCNLLMGMIRQIETVLAEYERERGEG